MPKEISGAHGTVYRNMLGSPLSRVVTVFSGLLFVAALWRWRDLVAGEWIWLAGFFLTLAIRLPHSRRNAQNLIRISVASPGEASLLAVLMTAMVLPLAYLASGFPFAPGYSLPFGFTLAGAVMLAFSLWLFWRSHADLVRNWSPGLEIRENHQLITNGVYRHIRHPMYAAVLVSALAQPLLLQNWLVGPPAVVAFILFLAFRIPVEERMMADHFGHAYDSYCRRTGRLLPGRFV